MKNFCSDRKIYAFLSTVDMSVAKNNAVDSIRSKNRLSWRKILRVRTRESFPVAGIAFPVAGMAFPLLGMSDMSAYVYFFVLMVKVLMPMLGDETLTTALPFCPFDCMPIAS